MNLYKLIFLTTFTLLSFGIVAAQDVPQKKQELSVYGKGSFNSLTYDLPYGGDQKKGHGLGLGVQYAFYMNNKWSVSAGLEYEQYQSEAQLSDFNDHYATTDAEGTDFSFYATADTYREHLIIDMVNIPLLVRYETPLPRTNASIFGGIGVQMGIPASSKYQATVEELKTSGYFQQWDAMLDNPSFMGFGNWGTTGSKKQKLDIRNSYSLLLNLGFKQRLTEKQSLYVGFYAELGLNKLEEKNHYTSAAVEYDANTPTEFRFNPLFYSAPQEQGSNYIEDARIQAIGIKISYSFTL